tara:strand:- start:54 stop:425 length:372 start_codon:yes stop_codon:yes gene_type:complete
MKGINKHKNYLIILMLIISGCKNKSKTEVSNEPDPNLRSFDFLGECINENPLLMANLAEDEVKRFIKKDIISSIGIKVNDSIYSVNTKFKVAMDSIASQKFNVILRVISCKSYKLIGINEIKE